MALYGAIEFGYADVMSIRAFVVVFFLFGCGGNETAAGTVLLSESFEGDVEGTLQGNEESTHEITLEGGAKVSVKVTTGRVDSARYVRRVEVSVVDAAGAEITAASFGNPTNRGTESEVLHERLIRVSERRVSASGRQSNETTIAVRGDGTATRP